MAISFFNTATEKPDNATVVNSVIEEIKSACGNTSKLFAVKPLDPNAILAKQTTEQLLGAVENAMRATVKDVIASEAQISESPPSHGLK
jgi:hypothetical protein